VACPQLGNSDALAFGSAISPVCMQVGVSSQGAMSGRVRVAFVLGLKLLLPRPRIRTFAVARSTGTDV